MSNQIDKLEQVSILGAPVEQTLSDNKDKYSIGYPLMMSLVNEFDIKFHAVTNISKIGIVSDKIQIYETRYNLENMIKQKIILKYHYSKCAEKILKQEKISAIHQMSSFASGTGFSFMPIMKLTRDYPFIIGPAEARHQSYDDEYKSIVKRNHKLKNLEYDLFKLSYRIVTAPLFNQTLDDCDLLVAVNEETKEVFSKHFSRTKIRVIPLGIHSSDFIYSPSPNNHDILTVGSLIMRKGHQYLIKAMPKIIKDYPDTFLHIASDGPLRGPLQKLVKNLGIQKSVNFYGYIDRDDLISLYRKCTVFCHPSLSEGFCHVALESMAMGRPIVSTNNLGSKMVENGKTGIIIPAREIDAIADSILHLFDDSQLAYKMGLEARCKIEKEYDWKIIARKYYDVYQEVIN